MTAKPKEQYPLIEITLKKSQIGCTKKQRAVVAGLGLGKLNSRVIREKRPEIIGMLKKVDFLLEVKEVKS